MRGQRLAFELGQQPAGLVGRKQLEGGCVVARLVDAEAVALAGLGVHGVPGWQVGRGHRPHHHAFALGQAHVVAPLLLHAGQHCLRPLAQVQVNGAARLHRMAAAQAVAGEDQVELGRVGQIRLHLEQRRRGGGHRLAQGRQQRAAPGPRCANPPAAPWGRRPGSGPRAGGAAAPARRPRYGHSAASATRSACQPTRALSAAQALVCRRWPSGWPATKASQAAIRQGVVAGGEQCEVRHGVKMIT